MEDLDVMTQGADIARRRKLMEALQQSSMSTPIVGNTGVGQALAKLATAYFTAQNQKSLTGEEAGNRASYGQQLGNETTNYLDRFAGKPGQVMTTEQAGNLMNNNQAPNLAEPIKADPRAAVVKALTSQLPEMQKLGHEGMSMLQKPRETKEHVINGTLVRSDGVSTPQVAGTYGQDDLGPLQVVGKDAAGNPIQAQMNKRTGKYEYAPGGGQQINIDTQGNKEALSQTGKVLGEARQAVIDHSSAVGAAARLYETVTDPQVMTGFGANIALGFGSLAEKLGFKGQEGVAKTQALVTDLASNTLAKGEKMKGSFSDSDIRFLQDASAGKITLDAGAIQHIAGLAIQTAHNQLMNSSEQYQSASTVQGAGELAKLYPVPEWRSRIPDDPRFKHSDTGRVTYQSSLTGGGVQKPAAGKPGGVVHYTDYLKGGY